MLNFKQFFKENKNISTISVPIDNVEKPFDIDRNFDIPYFGGISNNNKTIYIDSSAPCHIKVNGITYNYARSLAIHEFYEKRKMEQEWLTYNPAHQFATGIERKFVENNGVNFDEYSKQLKIWIEIALNKSMDNSSLRIPFDLYMGPYNTDMIPEKRVLYNKMIKYLVKPI